MLAFLRIASAALAIVALAAPGKAAMDAPQKQEIETIIHDYLLANPEVLEEAFKGLQEKRAKEAAAKQAEAIAKNGDLLYNSPNQMVLGNPQGTITMVEFFDYNCGYCKRAVADMMALIDANPDLRIIMKEYPILAEGSVEAARISVALKDTDPSHYLAFHTELFSRPGVANAAKALEVARDLGLDTNKLKMAAGAAGVTDNIKEVHQLADSLGITGTPSYVIGTDLVPGALGYDALQAKVTAIRKCGATTCG
jgi:protein-disulfide isomerase